MTLASLIVAAVAAVAGGHVETHGLAVDLPAGWRAAHRSLTPQLLNPKERLTVATFPLRYRPVGCSQFPSSALRDLGPRDALVTIQERRGHPHFPRRPEHFGPQPWDGSEAPACVPRAHFTDHWQMFRDHGRTFHVLVAFGPCATRKTRREAWAILDGLKIH